MSEQSAKKTPLRKIIEKVDDYPQPLNNALTAFIKQYLPGRKKETLNHLLLLVEHILKRNFGELKKNRELRKVCDHT